MNQAMSELRFEDLVKVNQVARRETPQRTTYVMVRAIVRVPIIPWDWDVD